MVCSGVRLVVAESCWADEMGWRGSVGGGGMVLLYSVMCYYGGRWCAAELLLS